MRSKLFVPGVRPELFAKALAGDADALSFDLEDSVPEQRKDEARTNVAGFVRSQSARDAAKVIVVRVNALGTPHFEADLSAVACSGVALINIPKVESAEDIRAVAAVLERVETGDGIDAPIRLLATIETPRGLRFAAEIASAHPRVAGLQLGLADLFEPHGIDRHDPANLHATLYAMRMAAAEAGVFAWDAAFADLDDAEGFRAEARVARRLGYVGKSCIHPSQVALANEVFQPDAEQVAAARRIVAASREAGARGRGAFVVDGRMVDLPFLKRAEAIVASLDPGASSKQ
ncbi:CoA ester lyase [Pseudoxanthomonas yeongjuensis]|uniref:HpcH/HpaI aldolase/citrate lyase family protein n=1 Tax=Pseudoxanthomonas yeongjuensis TaxID=377616 RepID=UPI0013918E4B|nr:CoA ester lyase [Pseudoxanthomonas yeongjuensis]KAF1714632.1 CoA ester lyase [Pseudoxanthomonas yeongjuensis]